MRKIDVGLFGKRDDDKSSRILDRNAAYNNYLVSENPQRCCNPECAIPLESGKAHSRIGFLGEVCELCYVMYQAVNRGHFLAAHIEWEEENKARAEVVRRLKKS